METEPDTTALAIPSALLAEIQAAAEEEHRPAAEVLRDVIARGLGERRMEHQQARELGLLDDPQPLTDDYRQVLREKIAQGVQSLREGRVIDGEAFMAQMDSELAELERQGL